VTNGYVAPPRDELAASSEDDDSTESSVSEDDAEDAPVDAGVDNEESVSES